MIIAIGILLAVAAAAFVAAPFFTGDAEKEASVPPAPGPTEQQALERQKLDPFGGRKAGG